MCVGYLKLSTPQTDTWTYLQPTRRGILFTSWYRKLFTLYLNAGVNPTSETSSLSNLKINFDIDSRMRRLVRVRLLPLYSLFKKKLYALDRRLYGSVWTLWRKEQYLNIFVFWCATSCSMVQVQRRFEGILCIHNSLIYPDHADKTFLLIRF